MSILKNYPPVWTTGWTDALNTGTWRSAKPVYATRPSPCRQVCPVDGDIPQWIQLARDGDLFQAWLLLIANNPLPAVTGRICHHPCEVSCNRKEYDGAVTINALEQFVADFALKENWSLPLPLPGQSKSRRMAVVGGGPAGLSCAYQLRRLGYSVTIFEAQPELGGVLRYGIPAYRLSKDVVQKEIDRLLALGFDVRVRTQIAGEVLTTLRREYDAVFWAVGAQQAKTLAQLPPSHPSVRSGLDLLTSVNQDERPELGGEVVVVGGGSVAMDAARTARRLGNHVTITALEERGALPAQPEEIEQALEEGIQIADGVMIQSVREKPDRWELACTKVTLEEGGAAGVLKPRIVPNTAFSLPATTVIVAIGQDALTEGLPAGLAGANALVTVDHTQATGYQGIFAGGDVTSLDRYVSVAIANGRRAAYHINRYIYPAQGTASGSGSWETAAGAGSLEATETVSLHEINTFYFPQATRTERERSAPAGRLQDFAEVRAGLSAEQFKAQAGRCFSCGHCLQCDNCYYFCPDMAVAKNAAGAFPYEILDRYCKGCGICVEECPRGVPVLKEERP